MTHARRALVAAIGMGAMLLASDAAGQAGMKGRRLPDLHAGIVWEGHPEDNDLPGAVARLMAK